MWKTDFYRRSMKTNLCKHVLPREGFTNAGNITLRTELHCQDVGGLRSVGQTGRKFQKSILLVSMEKGCAHLCKLSEVERFHKSYFVSFSVFSLLCHQVSWHLLHLTVQLEALLIWTFPVPLMLLGLAPATRRQQETSNTMQTDDFPSNSSFQTETDGPGKRLHQGETVAPAQQNYNCPPELTMSKLPLQPFLLVFCMSAQVQKLTVILETLSQAGPKLHGYMS